MPIKSQPKERPIIEMLLSAYDNDAWKAEGALGPRRKHQRECLLGVY